MLRGFAEGDDADFIFGLRVNDRNRDAGKQTERLEPLLAIGKARVFVCECESIEDRWGINEIEAMILDIAGTFALRPGELHSCSVATIRRCRKCLSFGGLTFDMSGGAKGAKRPLRRPLDGGVRCLRSGHGAFWQLERWDATSRGRTRRRSHRRKVWRCGTPQGRAWHRNVTLTSAGCDTAGYQSLASRFAAAMGHGR